MGRTPCVLLCAAPCSCVCAPHTPSAFVPPMRSTCAPHGSTAGLALSLDASAPNTSLMLTAHAHMMCSPDQHAPPLPCNTPHPCVGKGACAAVQHRAISCARRCCCCILAYNAGLPYSMLPCHRRLCSPSTTVRGYFTCGGLPKSTAYCSYLLQPS